MEHKLRKGSVRKWSEQGAPNILKPGDSEDEIFSIRKRGQVSRRGDPSLGEFVYAYNKVLHFCLKIF